MKKIAMLMPAILCVGCASIVNDSTQGMKIDTKTASGEMVTGAECKISNNYGTTAAKSGETALIRRSGDDLSLNCKHPNYEEANARAISRANAGFAGNIIFGGGIGAIIDHSKGTAYTYPTWIQLVFGKSLVFDRSSEKEGTPTPAQELATNTGK